MKINGIVCVVILYLLLVSVAANADTDPPPWTGQLEDAMQLARAGNLDSARQLVSGILVDSDNTLTDSARVVLLTSLGNLLRITDQRDSARIVLDSAIKLGEHAYGTESRLLVKPLSHLARLHLTARNWGDAQALYVRAIAIEQGAPGGVSPALASLYNAYGNYHRRTQDLDSAEYWYDESIVLYEALPDSFGGEMAQPINGLAIVRKNQLRYTEAEALYLRALELWTQHYGEDHPRTSLAHGNLCNLYRRMGRLREAQFHIQRALAINRETYGENHSATARDLQTLAMLYQRMGRLEEAAACWEEAGTIIGIVYGSQSPLLAMNYNRHGMVLHYLGWYEEAEAAFLQTHSIWETQTHTTKVTDPVELSNLGNMYHDLGRYRDAERLHRQYMAFVDTAMANRPVLQARARISVARDLQSQGRVEKAESLLIIADDILREHQGVGSAQEVIRVALRRQILEVQRRHWRQADSLIELALEYNQSYNDDSPTHNTFILQQRAWAREREHRFDEAADIYRECFNWYRSNYAPDHPATTHTGQKAGWCLTQTGEIESGIQLIEEATQAGRNNLRRVASGLADADALRFAHYYRDAIDAYFSAVAQSPVASSESHQASVDILLMSKGEVFDELIRRRIRARTIDDDSTAALTEELRIARYQLSRRFVSDRREQLSEGYGPKLDSLAEQIQSLESELARRTAGTGTELDRPVVSSKTIAAALGPQEILVDFLRVNSPDTSVLADQYVAAVLEAERSPRFVSLGSAVSIDELCGQLRRHTSELARLGLLPTEADARAYRRVAGSLAERIWDPLHLSIDSGDVIIVGPDAALHKVAFAALPMPDGRYLVEACEIRLLSTGRDLLRSRRAGSSSAGLLVVGDPAYRVPRQQLAETTLDNVQGAPTTVTMRALDSDCGPLEDIRALADLPYSRQEALAVQTAWSESFEEPATLLLGVDASESRFKREAPGQRVMHLATHGYFIAADCASPTLAGSEADWQITMLEHPLLASGLCMAGAASIDTTGAAELDDGFLTAAEVVDLDLNGIEMVVLSACESGLGSVRNAEGVFGLRRAFLMAGARSVVSSLWTVSDRDAAETMTYLYESPELSLSTRLRRAQISRIQALRSQGKSDHPVTWAAWVAVDYQ